MTEPLVIGAHEPTASQRRFAETQAFVEARAFFKTCDTDGLEIGVSDV